MPRFTLFVTRYSHLGDVSNRQSDRTQTVLTIDHPGQAHNGGWLSFGPKDGCFYVGVGDGGNGYDTKPVQRNPDTGNA